jgi:hypothetical protein
MEYLLEWSNYYKVGDVVYISYWYNGMITPVRIKEIRGRKYLVDHGIDTSQIKNAPPELITRKDIISTSPES